MSKVWSRIAPTSAGLYPFMFMERIPTFFEISVVPYKTKRLSCFKTFINLFINFCSCVRILLIPLDKTYSIPALRPAMPTVLGVPLSNLNGILLVVIMKQAQSQCPPLSRVLKLSVLLHTTPLFLLARADLCVQ